MNRDEKLGGGLEWRVVWAVSCYHLWLWRNKENFNAEFVRPRNTTRYILQYVENYDIAKRSIQEIIEKPRVTIQVRWEAPSMDWICINTDWR
jgi:hypothetical protein